ncbi:protein translocase subunit SecF [Paenibacillus sp. P96]|uniref:Protein-export membrane protein SecF n=1 Tax=Paenibacillus zeirhizosphaerae TaxID=2987519 RepID=A0ABT9FKD9_9BACL|nr:protein translocase subunit SecF [Paenibacillus sp. P96]MDP4095198.1 protein translocase subunit SecF [Paenibacillus sp. P96]
MRFNWNWDYMKASKYFYGFSIALAIVGMICVSIFGLNYGVDFRSGSNVDVNLTKQVSQAQIQSLLDSQGIGEDVDYTPGNERFGIRFSEVLTDQQVNQLKTAFNSKLDQGASFEVNTVDTEMAKELERNAIYAVLIACVAIAIFVSIRFEWRFAIAAIVSLLHDAILVIAIFAIFRLEIDLTFITAILTIVGFSINDTIVIFDRIRENLRFAKKKSKADLAAIVNQSIAQTMTRSLATVFTVFIASVCLLIFGGASIRMFSLSMVIGLLFGAYSSIFIAAPLWLGLKSKQKPPAAKAAKPVNP